MIYFIIWGKGVTEKLMDDSFVDDYASSFI